jgi:purine-nucleoside phosphorylase
MEIASPIGVILGSGLGSFANELDRAETTPYSSIDGMPSPSATGHAGKMVTGTIGGVEVIVLAGRSHLYEGYTPAQVTQSIRLLYRSNVRSVVITNAAGGIAEDLSPGDLALITDHINLQGFNPLVGPDSGFPDMTEAYSLHLRECAHAAAAELGIVLKEGVYAGLLGPSYETPAEIRYLARIGADLVGMSTVPEVIVATALGMRVLGISCVTNKAAGLGAGKLHHEEVLEIGRRSNATFTALLKAVLPLIAQETAE